MFTAVVHSLVWTKGTRKRRDQAMKHARKISIFIIIFLLLSLSPRLPLYTAAADDGMTNLTQNSAVTVTATVQDGLAKGLTDGDTTTASKATATAAGAWTYSKLGSATIDLGAVYSISQINGYFGWTNGVNKPAAFTIDISTNNAAWTTFASEDETKAAYAHDYVKKAASDISARYIRLTVNVLSGDHFRVRELEVYGYSIYDKSTNLTQHAHITLTCSPNDASVAGAVDGDNKDANTYKGEGSGAWVYYSKNKRTLDMNLGSAYHVDSVRLYFGYNGGTIDRPEGFTLSSAADMKNYTAVMTVTSGVEEKYDIPLGFAVHNIRLEIPSAAEARVVRVREIEIIGHPFNDEQLGAAVNVDVGNEYFILGDDDPTIDVSIKNLGDEPKEYSVEYTMDGSSYTRCASGTADAGGTQAVAIDLSDFANGKYADFGMRVYYCGILVKEISHSLTKFKKNEPKPMSEYSRIGVNRHIEYNINRQQKGRYDELISLLGISKTRSIHRWAWVETTKGERPFGKNDEVDSYMAQYNLSYAPYILGFGNPLYFDEEPRTYADVMDELEYNKQIVNNLTQKGIGIESLEIWNEPNLESFWKSDRSITYSQLANRIGFDMKKLCPDKQIMGAAIASSEGGTDYLDKYYERGALMYTDGFSFHPYTYAMPSAQDQYDTQYYNKLKSIMQSREKAGGWVTATATEIGYPTHDTQITRYGVTDEVQAALVPKYYIMNDNLDVAHTDWYTFEDTTDDPSDPESNFGLVQYDLEPKDSYVSIAQLVNHLADSEYIGRFAVTDDDYMYVYTSPDGIFGVTWSGDKTKTFSLSLADGTVAEDLYGNVIANGGDITVTYKPVYLTNIPETYLYRAAAAQAEKRADEIIAENADFVSADRLSTITAAFRTADTKEKLKSAIDSVYVYGTELAQSAQTATLKETAVVLSRLERMAKHGLIAYSRFEQSAQASDALFNEVKAAVAAKKGDEPDSSLLYTDAMMRFAERYHQKANEIKANYPSLVGIAAAYDEMATGVLNWVRLIMNCETPDLGRAVFTYIADTNPTVNKGESHDYIIEIENQLSSHTVDGDLVLKDADGNTLGAAVKCTVAPGECAAFTVSGTVPHDTADGENLLYIELAESGTVLKLSEIEVTVRTGEEVSPLAFYDMGIYNESGAPASYRDLHRSGTLTAAALIKKTGTPQGTPKAICAMYDDSGLENIELVPIESFDENNEYLLSVTVNTTEKTSGVSLFSWDMSTLKALTKSVNINS